MTERRKGGRGGGVDGRLEEKHQRASRCDNQSMLVVIVSVNVRFGHWTGFWFYFGFGFGQLKVEG